MPKVALVVIEKEYLGETWSNTHAFLASPVGGPLLPDDLEAIIGGDLVDGIGNAETDPGEGDPTYAGGRSPLAAAIGFERMLHYTSVKFTRVYVSDGKTPEGQSPIFATFPVNFFGLLTVNIGDVIAPLSNVLQLDRVPYGFSARPGRLQLRAALLRVETMAGPVDGIELPNEAVAPVTSRVEGARDDSLIGTWFTGFGPDPFEGIKYVIPKYKAAAPDKGSIVGYSYVSGITVDGAKARQVGRGKKKKVGP